MHKHNKILNKTPKINKLIKNTQIETTISKTHGVNTPTRTEKLKKKINNKYLFRK